MRDKRKAFLIAISMSMFLIPVTLFLVNLTSMLKSDWLLSYFNSDSAYIPVLCHDLKNNPYYFFEWVYPRPNFIFPDLVTYCLLTTFSDPKSSALLTSLLQYFSLAIAIYIVVNHFVRNKILSFYLASFGIFMFVVGLNTLGAHTMTIFLLANHAYSYPLAVITPYLVYKHSKESKSKLYFIILSLLSIAYTFSDPLTAVMILIPATLILLVYKFPKNIIGSIVLMLAVITGLILNVLMPCVQNVDMKIPPLDIMFRNTIDNLFNLITLKPMIFLLVFSITAAILDKNIRLLVLHPLTALVIFSIFETISNIVVADRYINILYVSLIPSFVLFFNKRKTFLYLSVIISLVFVLHILPDIVLGIYYWSPSHYYAFLTKPLKFMLEHNITSFDAQYWIAKRDTFLSDFRVRANAQHSVDHNTYRIGPYFHMMNVYRFLRPLQAYVFNKFDGSTEDIIKAIRTTLGESHIIKLGDIVIALGNSTRFKYWMASHPLTIGWVFAEAWRMRIIKKIIPFISFPEALIKPNLTMYWFSFEKNREYWRTELDMPPGSYVFELNDTSCTLTIEPHRSHLIYVYYVRNDGYKSKLAMGKTLYRIIHDFSTSSFDFAISVTEWNLGTGFRIPIDVRVKCDKPFKLTIALK